MYASMLFAVASCAASFLQIGVTAVEPHSNSSGVGSHLHSPEQELGSTINSTIQALGYNDRYNDMVPNERDDKEMVGAGLHSLTDQGSSIIVQRLDDRERPDNNIDQEGSEVNVEPLEFFDSNADETVGTAVGQEETSWGTFNTQTIVILSFLGVFIVLMFFSHEGSSVVATWDVTKQEKVIHCELPGYIPVFIPMYNETLEEVERTCNNFRVETVANSFVRDELMVYFVVDNTRKCDAVKSVLKIAQETLDPDEELPMQLGVPYFTGKLHGIPFKMYFKTESKSPDVIRGKRFSALLFTDLVKDDADSGALKQPWATICLDADVVTFPYSIENLVVQLLQNPNVTVTCGNILPSVDQTSLASRVQAAEYFLQNRIVKNAEALFGVVTCCPGAFLLMEFDSFRKTVQAAFSIDTAASSCLMRNALDLGEDRFLTSLLLIHKSKWTSFLPAANCTTQVPETWEALAKQRRRWFNSSLSNDIYIIRHVAQMFKSMLAFGREGNKFMALSRFLYLVFSTMMRLIGACFSVLFSVMLMSATSFILSEEGWCWGIFCRYYTFLCIFSGWVIFMIWSFHRAALNPDGFFERRFGLWLKFNLSIATVLMLTGTSAIAIYGDALQGQLMALTTMVLVGIYFFLVVNMAEHRSTFGLQLMISLLVYLIVGLPFLAFMQPIVALSQVDNFNWGTRETKKTGGHGDTQENQKKARLREKIVFVFLVFAVNGVVLFGIIESIGGRAMITTFCYTFIATQFIQVLFGMVRNVHLIRQSKKPIEKSYEPRKGDTSDENSMLGGQSPNKVNFSDPELQNGGVRNDITPVTIIEDNTTAHREQSSAYNGVMYDDDSCY